jgi:hypothetical protein
VAVSGSIFIRTFEDGTHKISGSKEYMKDFEGREG